MDIKSLLSDSRKETICHVGRKIDDDLHLIEQTIELAFQDVERVSARAVRVLNFIAEKYADIFVEHYPLFIHKLKAVESDSVKSGILRLFSLAALPGDEDDIGRLMALCFEYIENPQQKAAIKVYALEILYRISHIYPEIKYELILLIKKYIHYEKPSFYSRGSQIMKKLHKEVRIMKISAPG